MGVSIVTVIMTNFMSDGATVGALGPIALPMAELGNVSLWKVGLMLSFASSTHVGRCVVRILVFLVLSITGANEVG